MNKEIFSGCGEESHFIIKLKRLDYICNNCKYESNLLQFNLQLSALLLPGVSCTQCTGL
jgi:hypothetical protein